MRGGRVIIIVGVVLFLGAVLVGVISLAGGLGCPQPPSADGEQITIVPTEVPTMDIVVAAQNLSRGAEITEDNDAVTVATWPKESVPPGALTDPKVAYGSRVRTNVPLGMPITEGVLVDNVDVDAMGSDTALMIPPGKVAYAFAVAGNASVAWAIRPGDHVDVLVTLMVMDINEEYQTLLPNRKVMCLTGVTEEGELLVQCEDVPIGRVDLLPNGTMMIEGPDPHNPMHFQLPRLVTQMTVQDAVVLRVGAWLTEEEEERLALQEANGKEKEEEKVTPVPQREGTTPVPPTPVPPRPLSQWVTVAISPQDALVLKYAEETGASMDLVLRSAYDEGYEVPTQAVTVQYIFERYGIEAPPKLPYAVIQPTTVGLRVGAAGEVVAEEGAEIEYSRWHQVTQEEVITSE